MSKLYTEQRVRDLGEYYTRHVEAMITEGLHDKGDIAAQLGARDKRLDALGVLTEAQADRIRAIFARYRGG